MGPPLNKKPFKNLLAVVSSNMEWAFDADTILLVTALMLPSLVKGRATAATRAATSSPAAAAHTMASAAVNMWLSPIDTAFRSGAASAALTRSWDSFGRAAHAFLRILEPEGEKRR
jgi:hypothetical protein